VGGKGQQQESNMDENIWGELEQHLKSKIAAGVEADKCCMVFSMTYRCSRGNASKASRQAEHISKRTVTKIGCLFSLRMEVWQLGTKPPMVKAVVTHDHTQHVLGAAMDRNLLKPDLALEEQAAKLLRIGIKPFKVC
jgi:hypothetical protein